MSFSFPISTLHIPIASAETLAYCINNGLIDSVNFEEHIQRCIKRDARRALKEPLPTIQEKGHHHQEDQETMVANESDVSDVEAPPTKTKSALKRKREADSTLPDEPTEEYLRSIVAKFIETYVDITPDNEATYFDLTMTKECLAKLLEAECGASKGAIGKFIKQHFKNKALQTFIEGITTIKMKKTTTTSLSVHEWNYICADKIAPTDFIGADGKCHFKMTSYFPFAMLRNIQSIAPQKVKEVAHEVTEVTPEVAPEVATESNLGLDRLVDAILPEPQPIRSLSSAFADHDLAVPSSDAESDAESD